MRHDDGRMNATWFQGSAADFVAASKAGWDRGVSVLHALGGTSIDLCGARAIAQTRMTSHSVRSFMALNAIASASDDFMISLSDVKGDGTRATAADL
jgi:hypothetical protein